MKKIGNFKENMVVHGMTSCGLIMDKENELRIRELEIGLAVANKEHSKDVDATKLALDLKSAETERRLDKQDKDIEDLKSYKDTMLGRGTVIAIIIPIIISAIFLLISHYLK